MQITSVTITYGRTVQPVQYESKKAEAQIVVAFDEDESAESGKIDQVIAFAMGKVHEMVGLKIAAPAKAAVVEASTKEAAAQNMNAADANKQKATPPKTRGKATEPKGEQRQVSETPEDRKGPQDDPASVTGADAAAVVEDPTAVPEAEVTDKELIEAVTAAADKTKKLPDIRKLIVKFVGKTPCKAIDIGQTSRRQFLKELADIKA